VSQITFAVGAASRLIVGIAVIAQERGHGGIGAKDDIPSRSAVPAYGSSFGLSFGAHKRNNPRTTVSGAEVDSDSVDKHDRLLLLRDDVYMTTVGTDTVFDDSFTLGEEGVIAALADLGAWVNTGPTLADKDGSCGDYFAVKDLGAETFCF
jgi:hypothetical protein